MTSVDQTARPLLSSVAPGSPLDIQAHYGRDAWNRLVVTFPNADVRQSYEWGELLAGEGWTPHRFAVCRDGKCVACMTVFSGRLAGVAGSVLFAPRGPLLDASDQSAWTGLMDSVRSLAATIGAVFLRVSPNATDTEDAGLLDALRSSGFVRTGLEWAIGHPARATMLLQVPTTESESFGKMHPEVRRRLRRALERGFQQVPGTTLESMLEFRRDLVSCANAKGYPVRRERYFQELWRLFAPANGRLAFWMKDGVRVAADFSIRFGGRAYALFFAQRLDDRNLEVHRVSDLGIVRWARATGCSVVDYGSAGTTVPPSPGSPGYGMYRYKHELGCRLFYTSGYYDLVFRKRPYRLLRMVEDKWLPSLTRLRSRFNR